MGESVAVGQVCERLSLRPGDAGKIERVRVRVGRCIMKSFCPDIRRLAFQMRPKAFTFYTLSQLTSVNQDIIRLLNVL